MSADGTNGLSDQVDNHIWRLVWTSILGGGLEGGRQMLMVGAGQEGAWPLAAGLANRGNSVAQQQITRAQDTRPTLTVRAGDLCQLLTTKALKLPAAN